MDNGCNTVVLTGNGEPLQNIQFLRNFSHWNKMLRSPFQWIELQTTGVLINDENLRFLRNAVGVTTISISVSSIFNDKTNLDIIGVPESLRFDLEHVCAEIKRYDFNLRLSLNMTKEYDIYSDPDVFFKRANELGADQIIFREFYTADDSKREQNDWIRQNRMQPGKLQEIHNYIKTNGRPLELLPTGATRYSLNGLSTVFDGDCMSKEVKESLRYLILQPNCKLYSKWDDKASLIF